MTARRHYITSYLYPFESETQPLLSLVDSSRLQLSASGRPTRLSLQPRIERPLLCWPLEDQALQPQDLETSTALRAAMNHFVRLPTIAVIFSGSACCTPIDSASLIPLSTSLSTVEEPRRTLTAQYSQTSGRYFSANYTLQGIFSNPANTECKISSCTIAP